MSTRPQEFLIRAPQEGFGWGLTPITRAAEASHDTGMDFGVLRLRSGERHAPDAAQEGAYLLLAGSVAFEWGGRTLAAQRGSLIDEEPMALHFPTDAGVQVRACSEAELVLVQTHNPASFPVLGFDGRTMAESEHRGQGRLDDTAYRIVRTLFDLRNRPQSRLVLGEVVNFPGRWSSYPPHHHPQPEIYHYRFAPPAGYGHAELGEDVLRVHHGDTVKILEDRDHPQVAAPGYAMYYVWAIRHLPGRPYDVPTFAVEHAWLNQAPSDRAEEGQR